ncbi:MAG TPA: response regulator, partial [Candidatus Methanofastidiosa archaeon]|nr:response regulator [Candidatus Methanofastidiosa archaeon]
MSRDDDGPDPLTILYVDDEEEFRELTKRYLERKGDVIVHTAASAAEALNMLRKRSYDAIVSDYQMPRIDGVEFLKKLRSSGDNSPFILFTGKGREDVAVEAFESGADH